MSGYTCYYSNSKTIQVSERTVNITPLTFSRNGGIFEPESINYFYTLVNSIDISGQKNIVDIGAQSGLYSLYAKYLSNSRIYAFEANPETYDLLLENIELNGITNVVSINKGLGKEEAQLQLHVPTNTYEKGLCCFGSNPIRFSSWEDTLVEVTTMDKEFYEKDIPVHFIKCDTEGWELNILKGGKKTLEKWSPEIMLEVCDLNLKQCGTSREELIDYLESIGYKLVSIKDGENYHYSKRHIN